MAIKNDLISVSVTSRNVNHFRELGYDVILTGNNPGIVEVKYEDIPLGSTKRIEYICDFCEEVFERSRRSMREVEEIDGRHSCGKCRKTHKQEAGIIPKEKEETAEERRLRNKKYREERERKIVDQVRERQEKDFYGIRTKEDFNELFGEYPGAVRISYVEKILGRKIESTRKKRRLKYSEGELIDFLRYLEDNGLSTYAIIKEGSKEDRSKLNFIRKHYGGVRRFQENLGKELYRTGDVFLKPKEYRLRELRKQLWKGDIGRVNEVLEILRKRFGMSKHQAYKELQYRPPQKLKQRRMRKSDILNIVREISCGNRNISEVVEYVKTVFRAPINGEILNELVWQYSTPLDFLRIRYGGKRYTKNMITEIIKESYRKGFDLSRSSITANQNSLIKSAENLFGGWREAIEAAGIAYEEVQGDPVHNSVIGYSFEKVTDKYFPKIFEGIEVSPKLNGKTPDYALTSEGVWIDVKAFEHSASSSNSDTIKEYSPLCEKLKIIYLVGRKDRRIHENYSNVEYVPISEIIDNIEDGDIKKEFRSEVEELMSKCKPIL